MLQTFLKYCSPPETIRSARDWLKMPPRSAHFLKFLNDLRKVDVAVMIPFRIIQAWTCEEENKEDIVYIEAILPEEEEVFPEVHVMEKTDTVESNHKLTRFLVRFEDYIELLVRQKHQLNHECQGLDAINQALIGRMDKDHFQFFTMNIPQEMHAGFKELSLADGLLLNSENTDDEGLLKLIRHHQNGDLGA